jgi:hypothetical protein
MAMSRGFSRARNRERVMKDVDLFSDSRKCELTSCVKVDGRTILSAKITCKKLNDGVPHHSLQANHEGRLPVGNLGCLIEGQPLPARDDIQVSDGGAACCRCRSANLWTIDVREPDPAFAQQTLQHKLNIELIEESTDSVYCSGLGLGRRRMKMCVTGLMASGHSVDASSRRRLTRRTISAGLARSDSQLQTMMGMPYAD